MSEPRDDTLEIPVERLPGGRGQRRRAAVAVVSIVAVVGGAFGLARLAADDPGTPPIGGSHGALTALGSATAGPSPTVSSPRRSSVPRVEQLLDLPDRALDGAPHVSLVEQVGLDLRVREWTPGAGITTVRTVPDVVTASDSGVVPVLAPTGDGILLLVRDAPASGTGGTGGTVGTGVDQARLIDGAGRVLWTASALALESGAVWSTDGRTFVVAGNDRRWHIVSIGRDGTASDHVVRLPYSVFLPAPPVGSVIVPPLDPRTIPLGFSADGRWAYGGVISPDLGILIGEFRVALAGGTVEQVQDLGIGRPDGLVPELGGRLVDPATGRIANWRVNADTTGDPPRLEVRNADNGLAFVVRGAIPLGSGWDGHGGLVVLSADILPFPDDVSLELIGADGAGGPPIVRTGPVSSAGFIGTRNGYAALVISVTRPSAATQIVLVDLAEPARISAVPLSVDDSSAVIAADLRP
jgi:hypothetical protein